MGRTVLAVTLLAGLHAPLLPGQEATSRSGVTAKAETRTVYPVREPLRLADGRPMVAIYFFPHWWEPWKSSDEAIRKDLRKLHEMGFNTLLIDHEWSQGSGNMNREHRLAKEAGMKIVPWLSLKTWGDMTQATRREQSKKDHGAAVDLPPSGYRGFLPYGPGTIELGVKYAADYLKRYLRDGAILHVRRGGKDCPVVALTVEAAWSWQHALDPGTRLHFCRWLRDRYGSIEKVNASWGTAYAGWFDVDPADTAVFDHSAAGDSAKRTVAKPVEDFVRFRAGIVSDALGLMRARLRQTHPNLLILAEIPYEFGTEHPHGWSYIVGNAAIPRMVEYADIVLLRGVGALSPGARRAAGEYIDKTGKPVIMTHRISPTQGPGNPEVPDEAVGPLWAHEAAAFANGIGYYSWNEMLDVHIAMHSGKAPASAFCVVDAPNFDRLIRRVSDINRRYLEIHEKGLEKIDVPPAAAASSGVRAAPTWR